MKLLRRRAADRDPAAPRRQPWRQKRGQGPATSAAMTKKHKDYIERFLAEAFFALVPFGFAGERSGFRPP